MSIKNNSIQHYDIKIWNAIKKEEKRQEEHIELIASENYTSKLVMQAQGSILTNKYAEGYPEKRYYGGCKYVDIIEKIAIKRAKILFGANYVNVQPHSGSQANFAIYNALLNPGDLILGMDLTHGGHLTHGSKVNISGRLYNTISYGIDENGTVNYKEIESLAKKYKPKMIIGGFSAYSGLCDWEKIRHIADTVNAFFLVDMAHIAGLVAAKLYPNPLKYAHFVTSTTHKTLAGPRGGLILSCSNDKSLHQKINSSIFPGIQGGPLMHIIAAKAIAFKEAMEEKFTEYQKKILENSKKMVQTFILRNYKIVSGNTYNHLFVIDLTKNKITGKEADYALNKANITVNKNTIPNDKQSPFITSGIRIGTPAITKRGMGAIESQMIANWISDILENIDNKNIINKIKKKVLKLCKKFPVYNK
ncbi:serine hydroxymethyltransferase [Buchnera aphidicola (Mollitrichosiphum nigrofasciatum)]|uniref:serine hydroxymethyltransferase n=1 Tax=Buchnera aphidicola TaxID=9 RepID=UPI0031B84B08